MRGRELMVASSWCWINIKCRINVKLNQLMQIQVDIAYLPSWGKVRAHFYRVPVFPHFISLQLHSEDSCDYTLRNTTAIPCYYWARDSSLFWILHNSVILTHFFSFYHYLLVSTIILLTSPSNALFYSMKNLMSSTKFHTASHKYTMTIFCSKKNKHRAIYKVWLKCKHSRKYWYWGLTNDTHIRLSVF